MADEALEDHRGSRGHGRHDQGVDSGWAKLKIEGRRRREAGAHRLGKDVIVGVNKYKLARKTRSRSSEVDNVKVREARSRA